VAYPLAAQSVNLDVEWSPMGLMGAGLGLLLIGAIWYCATR